MTYQVSVVQTSKAGTKSVVAVTKVDADEFTVGASDFPEDLGRRPLFGSAGAMVSFFIIDSGLWSKKKTLVAYFPAGTDWVVERG